MRQNVCANIFLRISFYIKSLWQKLELYRQTDQFSTELTWQNKIGNHQTVRVSLSLSGEKISRKVREQGGVRRGGGGYFKCDRENIQIRSVRSRWQPDPPQDLCCRSWVRAPLISFDGLLTHLSLSRRSVVVFTRMGLLSNPSDWASSCQYRTVLGILSILHN